MGLDGECPACGLKGPLAIFRVTIEGKKAIAVVNALPGPVGAVAIYYLDLFRPSSRNAVSLNKAVRLLEELRDMVKGGHIQIGREVARPCPPGIWAAAMQTVLDQRPGLKLPFINHNYLKKVAYDLADKEDYRREQARNEAERSGDPRQQNTSNHVGKTETVDFSDLSEQELARLPRHIRVKHGVE